MDLFIHLLSFETRLPPHRLEYIYIIYIYSVILICFVKPGGGFSVLRVFQGAWNEMIRVNRQ